MKDGRLVSGVIVDESPSEYKVVNNLLAPHLFTRVDRKNIEEQIPSKISAMPGGLLNVLTREEIVSLVSLLEVGTENLPGHEHHQHGAPESKTN